MSIDWSKAPSSATHYLPEQKDLGWEACWYKKDGDKWLVMNCARLEKRGHMEWVVDDSEVDKFVPLLVPRSAFSSEWNGQGLPPVGTVCRLSGPTRTLVPLHPEWAGCEVKIYAHFESDRGIKMAAYVSDDHMIGGCGVEDLFVRMPTPEQIAAEQREKAINQMISDAGYVDPKIGTFVAMRNLYDAGYRRQEEGK